MNHYVFELYGSDQERYCQVRKIVEGKYKLIQKTEDKKCGYFPGKWNSLLIKMTSAEWTFYTAKENEGLAESLKMEADQELQHGSFALMTFQSKTSFTSIKSMPLDDLILSGNLNGVSVSTIDVQAVEPPETEKPPETSKEKRRAEKSAEYETCLEKKTPEDREKFCDNKFVDDLAAAKDCKVLFNSYKISIKINY